ncbi:MAG TPA: glycogen synthase [Calditrichia bacterium]|nr:glycogen synthase [Calditrichota bacterium]HQU71872.1 glycogen synthase [Calditrichia bacterium]HQV34050.1 glycogen synthase [Calditrichia bacterium]
MPSLKIAMVSSEIHPFAKTGGLADVSGALGKYLDFRGHDVRLFMPYYDVLKHGESHFQPVDFLQNIPVAFNGFTLYFSVLTTTLPGCNADVYFIHCEGLYNRGSIYTDHGDEYLRYALMCHATLLICQRMGWGPDIFHLNDWQCGLLPLLLKTHYQWDGLFSRSKTLLSIHNIGYQGVFSAEVVDKLNLGPYAMMIPQEDLAGDMINYMKIGLVHSDRLSTVSTTYAWEIQTEEYGAGLHNLLRHFSHKLVGIVNGVDYEEWSPEADPYIPRHFSREDLSGKTDNKIALMKNLGLPYDPDAPVYGIIARLTPQKGFQLLEPFLLDFVASRKMRLVVLGSGEGRFQHLFQHAQYHYPDKVCFYEGYNNALSHLIEAGSDMFIMPSQYEPCGLNQIYSLRYGTVPIVRKTGGLADTVQFYNWEDNSGTGFVFEYFNSDSLQWAMNYAHQTWHHKDSWRQLMLNGMAQDFSWDRQVEEYIRLYREMVG